MRPHLASKKVPYGPDVPTAQQGRVKMAGYSHVNRQTGKLPSAIYTLVGGQCSLIRCSAAQRVTQRLGSWRDRLQDTREMKAGRDGTAIQEGTAARREAGQYGETNLVGPNGPRTTQVREGGQVQKEWTALPQPKQPEERQVQPGSHRPGGPGQAEEMLPAPTDRQGAAGNPSNYLPDKRGRVEREEPDHIRATWTVQISRGEQSGVAGRAIPDRPGWLPKPPGRQERTSSANWTEQYQSPVLLDTLQPGGKLRPVRAGERQQTRAELWAQPGRVDTATYSGTDWHEQMAPPGIHRLRMTQMGKQGCDGTTENLDQSRRSPALRDSGEWKAERTLRGNLIRQGQAKLNGTSNQDLRGRSTSSTPTSIQVKLPEGWKFSRETVQKSFYVMNNFTILGGSIKHPRKIPLVHQPIGGREWGEGQSLLSVVSLSHKSVMSLIFNEPFLANLKLEFGVEGSGKNLIEVQCFRNTGGNAELNLSKSHRMEGLQPEQLDYARIEHKVLELVGAESGSLSSSQCVPSKPVYTQLGYECPESLGLDTLEMGLLESAQPKARKLELQGLEPEPVETSVLGPGIMEIVRGHTDKQPDTECRPMTKWSFNLPWEQRASQMYNEDVQLATAIWKKGQSRGLFLDSTVDQIQDLPLEVKIEARAAGGLPSVAGGPRETRDRRTCSDVRRSDEVTWSEEKRKRPEVTNFGGRALLKDKLLDIWTQGPEKNTVWNTDASCGPVGGDTSRRI